MIEEKFAAAAPVKKAEGGAGAKDDKPAVQIMTFLDPKVQSIYPSLYS